MPDFRVTFFFEVGQSGFSESWYRTAASHQTAMNAARGQFLTKRLGFLASNIVVQAIRVTNPDPPRDSLLESVFASNPQAPRGDYPGLGVHVRVSSGPNYNREQIFRGPPDEWMIYSDVLGAFTYNATWRLQFDAFSAELANNGWSLRVFDRVGVPAVKITNVVRDGGGLTCTVETTTPHGLVVGQTVALTGVIGRIGPFGPVIRRPTGQYQVAGVITPVKITVIQSLPSDYLYDHGGTARLVTYAYPIITRTDVREPRTRRPGRAFFVPVGRR